MSKDFQAASTASPLARINRLRNVVLALGMALVMLSDFVARGVFVAYVALVAVMVGAWAVARVLKDTGPAKAEG